MRFAQFQGLQINYMIAESARHYPRSAAKDVYSNVREEFEMEPLDDSRSLGYTSTHPPRFLIFMDKELKD